MGKEIRNLLSWRTKSFALCHVSRVLFRLFDVSLFPVSAMVILFILSVSSISLAMISDCSVAFVDNTAITLSELDQAYSKAVKVNPGITKEEVLNGMVNRVLLLREAKKMRLQAPNEDAMLKEYIDLKIRPFIRIREENVSDYYEKHIEDFKGKAFDTVRKEIENYLTEAELNHLLKKHIDELGKKSYIKIELTQPQ
jgi:Tfp pilus assembly PilM family ATPase